MTVSNSWLPALAVTRIGAPVFLLLGATALTASLSTVWIGNGLVVCGSRLSQSLGSEPDR